MVSDGGFRLPAVINPPGRRILAICVPDDPVWRQNVAGALVELGYWFNWERDEAHRAVQASTLWMSILETALQRFDMGEQFCFTCDELTACLQPLYDQIAQLQTDLNTANTNILALNSQLDSVASDVTDINNTVNTINSTTTTINNTVNNIDNSVTINNTVQEPAPVEAPTCPEPNIYAGAKNLIRYMNDTIIDLFEQAEASFPDNAQEMTDIIISMIPVFETLPLDELYELSQYYFDTQKANYEADYTQAFVSTAACDLFCRIKDNNCVLTADIIGTWLMGLDDLIPNNYAALMYAKFGNATQPGLAEQIGQFINELRGGESIAHYFDTLLFEYETGLQAEDNGYFQCSCTAALSPIGITTNDCHGEVFGAAAECVYVSGDMWDINVNVPVVGGYGAHIREVQSRPFAYEVVSGAANATVCLNNQTGTPVCHYSGNGGGFIDQNQSLLELSIFRTSAQGAATVRIHFKVP